MYGRQYRSTIGPHPSHLRRAKGVEAMTAVSARSLTSTAIDIRLLGPLDLTCAAGPVPIGGPRLRTLVGLLALRAPEVVSRQALIDGIWDATPPPQAAKTLRAHVAYVRRG